MWTIYDNPRDYPGKFVVRRWMILSHKEDPEPSHECTVHNTLKQARASLPPGLYCMRAGTSDDPCIVETWL